MIPCSRLSSLLRDCAYKGGRPIPLPVHSWCLEPFHQHSVARLPYCCQVVSTSLPVPQVVSYLRNIWEDRFSLSAGSRRAGQLSLQKGASQVRKLHRRWPTSVATRFVPARFRLGEATILIFYFLPSSPSSSYLSSNSDSLPFCLSLENKQASKG